MNLYDDPTIEKVILPHQLFSTSQLDLLITESKKNNKNFIDFLLLNNIIENKSVNIFNTLKLGYLKLQREEILSLINYDKLKEIIANFKKKDNKTIDIPGKANSFFDGFGRKDDENKNPKKSSNIEVGDFLGKYKILNKIGVGATSTVYLCHHSILEMDVAIKVLNQKLVEKNPDIERIFLSEAKNTARLRHDNLVRVIDAEKTSNYTYIIMEFIDGLCISEIIEKNKKLSETDTVKIAIEVCKALEYAFEKGVIHRDIKPANMMLTKKPELKVTDFGLAKIVDTPQAYTTVTSGIVNGTPYYMSPEQYKDYELIDHRSDMYSLGVSLYHMVTGFLPFKGNHIIEIMESHFNKKPESPQSLGFANKNFSDIIMTLLEKDPINRFSNYKDLMIELRKIIDIKG